MDYHSIACHDGSFRGGAGCDVCANRDTRIITRTPIGIPFTGVGAYLNTFLGKERAELIQLSQSHVSPGTTAGHVYRISGLPHEPATHQRPTSDLTDPTDC